jgi:hypothetical protein
MESDPWILHEYKRLRSKHWGAAEALRGARILRAFQDAAELGLVKFEVLWDPWTDVDDILCVGSKRERDRMIELMDREGVWGMQTSYRDYQGLWETASAIWGFVGDDHVDSPYMIDVMSDALAKAKEDAEYKAAVVEAIALVDRCANDEVRRAWNDVLRPALLRFVPNQYEVVMHEGRDAD